MPRLVYDYHLSNDGRIMPCNATVGQCPYASNPHFDSVEEGEEYVRKEAEQNENKQDNKPTLEQLVLEADFSDEISEYYLREDPQSLDVAIDLVSKFDHQTTPREILKSEGLYDNRHYSQRMWSYYLYKVSDLWTDKEYLKSEKRNLLTPTSYDNSDWRVEMKHALASELSQRGELVSYDESTFSWEDFEGERERKKNGIYVTSVLDVEEDYWDEFTDTFAPNSSHTGVRGEVLLSDGSVREMRFEADVSDLIYSVRKRMEK